MKALCWNGPRNIGCETVPDPVIVDDTELAGVDVYEAAFAYERVVATLASGRQAWVYVYRPSQARSGSG